MTQYNTMRFLTDEFNPFDRAALIVSNIPVDLSAYNCLNSISVLGDEPTGTTRRFLFKMSDDVLLKFSGQNLVIADTTLTLDNVLANGNTPAQVQAVVNNHQLVGDLIYPIIAMKSTNETPPTCKLEFAASCDLDILDFENEATIRYFYNNDGDRIEAQFLGIEIDAEITGNASADAKISLLQNGTWTDFLAVKDARGQTATAFKIKRFYHVDACDGTNSVKIKHVRVYYSPDQDFKVYGDVAYIYSNLKYAYLNLAHCVFVVRHEDLDGGSIDADVSFQKTRYITKQHELGQVTSAEVTFNLPRKDIFPDTLAVYLDGVLTTDYDFDLNEGTITFAADPLRATQLCTVTYNYNCEEEVWLPMVKDAAQHTGNGLYTTRFALPNPDFDTKNLTISLVRLKISRGRETTTFSKTATGSTQTVKSIVYDDDLLDYDTFVLSFSAEAGTTVTGSYSWHGKTPVIRGWSVVWNVA